MTAPQPTERRGAEQTQVTPPTISLPKGGGAIRGIGEKFFANPVTGTGSMTVPIATSPGRSGFGPLLALSYDSAGGNGPFGFGWSLSLPGITRKTDKGLPKYRDRQESDVFILSGAEDLVPILANDGTLIEDVRDGHRIRGYRPRIEGLFARIERWTSIASGQSHWRSISRDNITTIYGRTAASRVADPDDATRIFSWLISETYDDKGNAVVYEYAAETSHGVDRSRANERNRSDAGRAVNRYLKRVKYGNRVSRLVQPDLSVADWLFEVVLDYEDGHYEDVPAAAGQPPRVRASASPGARWPVRPDPFSTYRAGFEVRTYRRCHRVLMFHRFDELGAAPYLVRAVVFGYADADYGQPLGVEAELAHKGSTRLASFLRSVTQVGCLRDDAEPSLVRDGVTYLTYRVQSLPPLEFDYSQALVQARVEDVAPDSLRNLPIGLGEPTYRWLDLDGEGLPGLLAERGGAWFYKRNVSPLPVQEDGKATVAARFAPMERVPSTPSSDVPAGARQFLDLAGDGQIDVVELQGPRPGYFERARRDDWAPFRSFASLPAIDWSDPNLRLADLTGDGHADVLVTQKDVLTWYPSRGEEGFDVSVRVGTPLDEETGPRVVFADGTQSTFLADMSGDGLADIVRIRNGEVCYWPNLGYGRFGAKVTMDHAPRFDPEDQFDQRRLRLIDIDGSGVTDIIYVGRDGVRLYFNQSGNRWSDAYQLRTFPDVADVSAVSAVDLLGNGTACLVWSSPLPGDARRPMRYLRLMGDKPHLLTRVVNNLGGETRLSYAPSTKLYLEDKAAGRPWATRLPFPVHVVEQVEVSDHVSRSRLVSRYSYHHGYFDGAEREFRGFGMIEQTDTEVFEDYVVGVQVIGGDQELGPEFFQPPVTTRTWFHTGSPPPYDATHAFLAEYYRQEHHLPEPRLPATADAAEWLECRRALKGLPVRHETYSFDGSPRALHPYRVTEYTYEVRRLQPRSDPHHAVFFTVGSESVSVDYDREPTDPRVTHDLSLDVDLYGNIRKSSSVVYGRRVVDGTLPADVRRDQQQRHITYNEIDYTPVLDQGGANPAYRLPVTFESRAYEITGVDPAADLFGSAELAASVAGAADIPYEAAAGGGPERRLLAQTRTLYLDNALNPRPLGQWDTLGLRFETYRLAFTPGVVAAHYVGHVSNGDFLAAGYVHFDGDANWWIPSGTSIYPADPAAHFFIPIGSRDPLGTETIATPDAYDLLYERIRVPQAPWNEVVAANDYRTLGPMMLTDANRNRTAIEMDALGLVVKTAVMGKAGAGEGDTLADPTVRMEYEIFNWMLHGRPNFVHIFAREQHGGAPVRWRESYAYSDGSGGVVLAKAPADPGKALRVEPDGTVTEVDADPRWVGNGRTILNNKGNPVKQYEPYFSTTHEYEDEKALRAIGVTPILYYDPLGRNVRTVFPNGTLTRSEIGAWKTKTFDANDTVAESQWYADRGSPDPLGEAEPVGDPERRAAWLAAKHAGTAATVVRDSLGRSVYSITDYGGGATASVRSESDLTGRTFKVFDQAGREVTSGFTGMSGTPIRGETPEKGRRWSFLDVFGKPVKTWDEHGREFQIAYDVLHRTLATTAREAGQADVVLTYTVYGDRHPQAEARNLRGAVHQTFDQAGVVQIPSMDFKGNPVSVERVLAPGYRNALSWDALPGQPDYAGVQAAAAPQLNGGETYVATATFDALNRPTRLTLPDGTVLAPTYGKASYLASLQAQLRGQGPFIDFLKAQEYDARGQRQFARYGNDLVTRYLYDPKTFRLAQLVTRRLGDQDAQALQRLAFTYDPKGNVTQVRDDAQQTHYFNNEVVSPETLYEYDAAYQLIRASGREHAGPANDVIRDDRDLGFIPQLPHVNDIAAVRRYAEEYEYDLLGNIKTLRHRFRTQAGVGAGWTRHYRYAYEDNAADRTNRLAATSAPGDPDAGPYTATYAHDAYGNMTRMPHLLDMAWNVVDQLRQVDLGGGSTAYYVYGANGQRVRRIVEQPGGRRLERIYLGALEIYRERNGDQAPDLERHTVHVSDNAGRVAQVDTKLVDDDGRDPANALGVALIRYQYCNHLGSVSLETNAAGAVVSYEEFHPFGTSAYRSAAPGADLSLKRYRFSGKERDVETGLDYFGARYYASWLGRWTSSDPAGYVDGLNTFRYCKNNPSTLTDQVGTQTPPLNPVGEVSWEIPARLFLNTQTGQRYDDATVLHNVSGWLQSQGRQYTPSSLVIDRWVDRTTRSGVQYQVPVINAEWHDAQGQPLLPREGEFGYVAPMRRQPRAEYGTPGDRSSRLTENEHGTPRAQTAAVDPDYGNSEYRGDATVRSPRGVSLDKTRGDNAASAAIQQRVQNGQPVDLTEDIDLPSHDRFQQANDRARAAGQPSIRNPGSITRGTLEQTGGRFERGRNQQLPSGAVIEEPLIEEFTPPSPRPSFGARLGAFGSALGTGLARTFIPGFVEAELAAMYAHPFVVGTLGITSGPLPAIAEAITAAPTQFAASVTLPAIGGAIVGNIVESEVTELTGSRGVGIGAAVLGAAATGAIIGTFIPIPGVGTAVGAAIGAAIGVIGYGISKLFF